MGASVSPETQGERIQRVVAAMRAQHATDADIEAYLTQQEGLTPEPAAPTGNTSGLDAAVYHAAQGLTFGAANPIVAGLGALMGRGTFHDNLAQMRADMAQQEHEHPVVSTLSELGGAVRSPVTRGLGALYKWLGPTTVLARAGAGALTAGAGGAAYGAATAEPGQRLHDAAVGGTLSALMGGVGSAPGSRLGKTLVGSGLGGATGAGIGALTGHPTREAVLGAIGGGILGAREPISDAERAQNVLRRVPPDAAQHMADIEAVAPGGSSLAGASPRLDKPYQSRLWRTLKGVGADEQAGATATQATMDRLKALTLGRRAVGQKMNVVAGPIEMDSELENVLKAVRPALKGETPGPALEDPAVTQIKALYPNDPNMRALALKQIGADETQTVDAEDLADALSTLNFKLQQAQKRGVDAQGVRKYTLQKAHDALMGYLTDRHPELQDLHKQYRTLSDEMRRLGNKGILTKIEDSADNFAGNFNAGKGAASVGGSITPGGLVHSPRGSAMAAMTSLFRPDEAKAGARFAAKYLLDPTMTPETLRLLSQTPPPASPVAVHSAAALPPLARFLGLFDNALTPGR